MKSNKEQYRQLCKNVKNIPLFSKDWWLDAVCGENNWNVVLVEKGGSVIGSLPYFLKKRAGFKFIQMPELTQNMGLWIRYPENQTYHKKLNYEKKVMTDLINQLPSFDKFGQNFHYSVTNWLPFYWNGFRQSTNYTYIIQSLADLEKIFSNFSHAKRKNINRAEKDVIVKFDLSAEEFYDNHKYTLKQNDKKISYDFQLFNKIYNSCCKRNVGKSIYAIDKNDNIHAALFVVWDESSAYNLISTIDQKYKNSGASSLVVREIIKFVATKTKTFDFEGSMIEQVENSFNQFATIQVPYFHIEKINSKALIFKRFLKDFKF